MDGLLPVITFAAGLLIGLGIAYVLLSRNKSDDFQQKQNEELTRQLAEREQASDALRTENAGLNAQLAGEKATRQSEANAAADKLAELKQAEERLKESFENLAGKTLDANNERFMQLAKANFEKLQEAAKGDLEKRQQAIGEIVNPIKESLQKVDEKIGKFDAARSESAALLKQQLGQLASAQEVLRGETSNLVNALRKPSVRGSWGEVQLRQAAEFAGMVEHCDFTEQESTDIGEGKRHRPDMVVKMPNGRQLVVDAKAPMEAYLAALDENVEAVRLGLLKDHARQVRDKIKDLAGKAYWKQFDPAPEFVVLFLPNEALFSAALEQDPGLINYGATSRVILATPTTFIALLMAVAYGWQQEKVATHAKEVNEKGRELYERVRVFADHFASIGTHLGKSVGAYNKAVNSAERRFLPAARKLVELGAANEKEIEPLKTISEQPEAPSSEELSVEVGDTAILPQPGAADSAKVS